MSTTTTTPLPISAGRRRSSSLRALAAGLLCAAAAVSLAGGCHKPPPPARQTGPLPVNSFSRVWGSSVDLKKKDSISQLHVRDDTVFVYSATGRVSALKRDTGVLQYVLDIKNVGDDLHPPVVMKDNVVFPTLMSLEVYARDGRFVRTVPLPFAVRTNASALGNFVFLCGDYPQGGARVVKVDVRQDYVPIRWDFVGNDGGRSGYSAGTTVVNDAVYAAGLDGNVYAVNANSREPFWPIPDGIFKTGGSIDADLVGDTSGIYVVSTDSVLYAINPNNGKLKWRYFSGAVLREAPVVTSSHVYLKVPGKGMIAFSKTEGKEVRDPLWTREDVQEIVAQDDKYAYARASDNSLLALDKATGETKFQSQRKDFVRFGVNTKDDGVIFAVTKDGTVLAIKGIFKPGVVGEQVRNDDADAKWESVSAVAMR